MSEASREAETAGGGGGLSESAAVGISAVVGLVVAALAYWWVGGWAGGTEIFFEELFRIQPTVSGGGVGSDWLAGNTIPWLDALIALVHAADVIMGVFILIMVFIHWASFRRLATRMRHPGREEAGGTVAADGSGTAGDDSGATEQEMREKGGDSG
ncbi:hypothetical protein [Haladaptatus sp. NG-SE-30]